MVCKEVLIRQLFMGLIRLTLLITLIAVGKSSTFSILYNITQLNQDYWITWYNGGSQTN